MRIYAAIGSWLGLFAVAAGAFGDHALRHQLDPARYLAYETAVRYQLIHAVALLALGLSPHRAAAAGGCFTAGTVLFSGSLYALALGAPRWIGAVTPVGGLLFLVGWGVLAVGLSRGPARA